MTQVADLDLVGAVPVNQPQMRDSLRVPDLDLEGAMPVAAPPALASLPRVPDLDLQGAAPISVPQVPSGLAPTPREPVADLDLTDAVPAGSPGISTTMPAVPTPSPSPATIPAAPEVDLLDQQRRALARQWGMREESSYPQLVERWMRDIPTAPQGATPEQQNAAAVAQRQYMQTMPELFRVMPDEGLRQGLRRLVMEKIRMQPTYTAAQKIGRGWERGVEGAKAGLARTGAGLMDYLAQAGEAAQYAPRIAGPPLVIDPVKAVPGPMPEAQAMREYAAKKEQRYAGDPGGPTEQIISGGIQIGANLAPVLGAGVVGGPLAGAGVAAAQSSGIMYDRVYGRLIERGFAPEEAANLATMAATGSAVAAAVAGGLPGSTAVSKTTAGIAAEGALEGAAYAGLQRTAEEAVVSSATGDALDLSQVPADMAMGGGLGAAISGGADLLRRGRSNAEPQAANRLPAPETHAPIRQESPLSAQKPMAEAAPPTSFEQAAVRPTAFSDRMARMIRGKDLGPTLAEAEAANSRELELDRIRREEQAQTEAENRLVEERLARGELPPAAMDEVREYNRERLASLEQQQAAQRRQQLEAIPAYSHDQLRRMPLAKLREAAQAAGVTFDSRSFTIPRILDAQAQRQTELRATRYEGLTDKELWEAGTREQNIATLAQDGGTPGIEPPSQGLKSQELSGGNAAAEAAPTPPRPRRTTGEPQQPGASTSPEATPPASPDAYQDLLGSSHFKWVLKKATKQTYPDGTVESFFEGRVPPAMRSKLYGLLRKTPAQHRDADTESVYNFRIGDVSYAIRFGAKKSTQDHIRVNVTDETAPARQAGMPGQQSISPVVQATTPPLAPAATEAQQARPKTATRTPRGFTKADLQRKLLEHADSIGEGFTAAQEAALESAQGGGNAFTFHKQLPGEVRQFIESNPAARRLFRVTENLAAAGGEDAMATLGDRYWTIAENRAGAKLDRALEAARNSPDPEMQFLAALHDNLPPAKERVPQTIVKPEDLQAGQSFQINGHAFKVVEGEEGYRVLRDGQDYPVVPLEALSQIPVDKGTLKDAPKFFDPESEGIPPRAQTGIFGQPEYAKTTGKQQGLFHDPVEIARTTESAQDARIARQYAEGEQATGNLFGKAAPSGEELKAQIRRHLQENPNASLSEIGNAVGIKPHGYAEEGNPLSNPLHRALTEMRDAGEIEARTSAMGGNAYFKLKEQAKGSGGNLADRLEGPLDVEGRRDLLRAVQAAKGQLRAVLYDDGGLAVGDAHALVHDDIIRATAGKRQAVARFLVQKRGNELVGYLTEGPASATQAPIWGKLGLRPDAKVDRLLTGSSDLPAGAGRTPSGGRSFADRPERPLAEAEPSPQNPARVVPREAQGPGGRTLRPVQMPELVKLAQELMGRLPEIKKLRAARGLFRPVGRGSIAIDLDTARDPHQLAKTMSHEIGHLWDFLSDRTMNRGNLLARAKSLRPTLIGLRRMRGFLKNTFGEAGPSNRELRQELMDLSAWWRPGDMNSAYRRSSVELYADALSVLLNSPGELAQKAPKFFKALMEHLDRKPEVFAAYMTLQDTLAGTPESLMARRRQDLLEGFSKAEEAMRARAMERQAADVSMSEWTRQMLYDSARPITDKTHALVKVQGRDPANLAAQYAMDELGYANNVNHLMLKRIDAEVMQPVAKAGLERSHLDEYLLLDRIAHGDRQAIANPQGHTPETAKAQLDHLKQTLGESKWQALQQAIGRFHDITFASVERAVEVGTYSREMFETTLKPNKDHYAAFGVVSHLQDTMPASIKQQVGTFSDVGGPFTLTAMKTVSLNRLNELQAAKNSVRDWLREHFGNEIQGPHAMDQYHNPPPPQPGNEHLVILEDGKPVAYEVDKYVAKMFQRQDIGGLGKLAKAISFWTYLRHPLYITGSPGFQVSNIFRDLRRTWVNLGALRGTSIGQVLKAYWDAKGPAWRRARGLDDATIERMLKEKALDTPFNRLEFGREDDGAYGRLLEQYGIAEPQKARNFFTTTLGRMWRGAEIVGTFVETMPKVAGFRILEREKVAGPERSYTVRNYVGTPNLRRRGLATDLTNGIAMYSNAFLQGARADTELALYRPGTRSGWAMRRVAIDILPKVIQKAALAGLFGATVKAVMQNVPSYDLANYTVIPVGVTGEGEDRKTAYLRIPHDETGRVIGAMLWAMLDSPESGVWKGIQNAVNHGYGGLPNWSPMLTEAKNWTQYLAGQNPTDFRNRPIIGRDEYTVGGWPAAKNMLRWQFDQFGVVSEIGRSLGAQPSHGQATTTETVLGTIPGLNRLLKVSDRGLSEDQWDEVAVEEAEAARFRLGLPEGVRNLLKERYRLSRLGLEKLEGRDLGRLAALDEFYAEYLKRTQAMKAAEGSGNNQALAQHRTALEALAKQTQRIYGPLEPQDQQRLRELARNKVLRSDSLSPQQQDAALQRAGIAPPKDLALARELQALNQRLAAAGKAKSQGTALLRQASAAAQKGDAATARTLKAQGLDRLRQSRLAPAEEARHTRLQTIHQRIRDLRRRMDEGTLDRQAGERQIDRLLEMAKAKPAA